MDWYLLDWTQTTNTIDYSIKEVSDENAKTKITLERIGRMPMPIDLLVVYEDGTQETFYIPNTLMRWEKPNPYSINRTVLKGWDWAAPTFSFTIDKASSTIQAVVIDPSGLMADVDVSNNVYEKK